VELRSLGGDASGRLPRWTRCSLVGKAGAPLILVLGGISGTSSVACNEDGSPGWWSSLFGPEAPFGPEHYRILGIDFVADPTGRFAPDTFEQASIVADTLGLIGEAPTAIVGASYGGMVALAYAQRFRPQSRLVIISAGASPHPMATAARSLQRRVVALGLELGRPQEALSIARGMAMLTYRSRREFGERFERCIRDDDPLAASAPGDYLESRGKAYVEVMPAGRFLSLSASIDRHEIDPARIDCPTLVIGVEEDQVVPLEDSAHLAARLGGKTVFRAFRSVFGHDAFLKETETLAPIISAFLAGDGSGAAGQGQGKQ